jgi:hypothetical protein
VFSNAIEENKGGSRTTGGDCQLSSTIEFGEVWRSSAKFDKYRNGAPCRLLIIKDIGF